MVTGNTIQRLILNVLAENGTRLVQNATVRRRLVHLIENRMHSDLKQTLTKPNCRPGIEEDKTLLEVAVLRSVERALAEKRLSKGALNAVIKILVQSVILEEGDLSAVDRFRNQYGIRGPSFLVLSPGKLCNLHCTGCYADSTSVADALDWSIVDRVIQEAKTLWGARFFTFSGGEPFAYRSEGKGILDLIEKHSDCMFLAFTNGTLIKSKVSQRLAEDGNLLPAISVEGWKEKTDARRGKGVFDKVLATMDRLRTDGVPFGISLTATRHNVEEILSDEFIDFFQRQGALFGWIFQYMPIGRSFTLDLMPTPQQRVWMWRRSWEIVRSQQWFLADFWNQGTVCDGCLSAGGHGEGGYFYIDWNGAVSPCVFMPYSPVNIKDVYAQGGTLIDVWKNPFFHALRQWQLQYKKEGGNGLAPCPNRDHHQDLEQLLMEHEPDPIDANAAAALIDPEYSRGLAQYDAAYQALTQGLWEDHYVYRNPAKDGSKKSALIDPLPDISNLVAVDKGETSSEVLEGA